MAIPPLAERKQMVIAAARKGNTQRICANAGGASIDALKQWLHNDPEFAYEFRRAFSGMPQKVNATLTGELDSQDTDRRIDVAKFLDRRYGDASLLKDDYGTTETEVKIVGSDLEK